MSYTTTRKSATTHAWRVYGAVTCPRGITYRVHARMPGGFIVETNPGGWDAYFGRPSTFRFVRADGWDLSQIADPTAEVF